MDLKDFLGPFI